MWNFPRTTQGLVDLSPPGLWRLASFFPRQRKAHFPRTGLRLSNTTGTVTHHLWILRDDKIAYKNVSLLYDFQGFELAAARAAFSGPTTSTAPGGVARKNKNWYCTQ